jgi:hypothetical protein
VGGPQTTWTNRKSASLQTYEPFAHVALGELAIFKAIAFCVVQIFDMETQFFKDFALYQNVHKML